MKKLRISLLYVLSLLLICSSLPIYAKDNDVTHEVVINKVNMNVDSYMVLFNAYNKTEKNQLVIISVSDNNVIDDKEEIYTNFGSLYVNNNKIYINLKANLKESAYDFELSKTDKNIDEISLEWNNNTYTEYFEEEKLSYISLLNGSDIFALEKGSISIDPQMSGTKLEMRMKFKIDSNGGSNGVVNGNMKIRLKFEKKYISYPSISPTKPGQLEGTFIKRDRDYDFDYYIVDYDFKNVNYGADVDFPLNFTAIEGHTPNNSKLVVTGEMTKDDVVVGESSVEFTALNKMDDTKIERFLAGTDGSFRVSTDRIYAGEEDVVKKGYFETDVNKIESIRFFLYSNYIGQQNVGGVEIEKYVAREYLPEEAVFDDVNSVGWTYDNITHSVTKEFSGDYLSKFFLGSKTVSFTSGAFDTIPYLLYLKFPGVKIDSVIKSRFEIDAYPKSKEGFPEKYTFSQEKEITLLKRPPKKYNDILYNDSSNNVAMYNTPTSKSTERLYYFGGMISKDSRDYAENLKFESKVDDVFRIKEIEIPLLSKSVFDGTLDIYYYLENDSKRYLLNDNVDISHRVNSTNVGYYYRFPDDLVVSKLEIETSENSKLYRSDITYSRINFRVQIILKDINMELTEGTIFKNESKVIGNLATLDTVETSQITNYTVTEPTPSLDMSLRTSKTSTNIKSPIYYNLNILGEYLNKDLVIDFNKMVVMLPTGFEYVKGSSSLVNNANGSEFGFIEGDISNEPRLELNYKNSGQNALVWDIPKGVTQSEDLISRNLRLAWTFTLEANKFAKEGSNEINAYLVLNEQGKMKYNSYNMTKDKYDFNDNGSTDDLVYHSVSKIEYVPPFELMIQKEIKGGLDNSFLVNPSISLTEKDMISKYNLKVFNNTDSDNNNITIVDILPYKGDKTVSVDPVTKKQVERNSTVDLKLVEEIEMTNGFSVQYSKEVPHYDSDNFLDSVVWYDQLDNIEDARAFKISGGELKSKQEMNLIVKVKISEDHVLDEEDFANSSFAISSAKNVFSTFESNIMPLEVVSYTVKGNLWTDFNHDSINNDVLAPIANHKVTLVDTNGNEVKDLDGNTYETMTDSNGDYEIIFHKNGIYRVKIETPADHELTDSKLDDLNGSHIINDGKSLSDEFSVTVEDRDATKNAGFKRDVEFKVKNRTLDANDNVLNNNDNFTYELTVDGILYNGIGKTLTGNDVNVTNGVFTLRTNEQVIFTDINSNVDYTVKQVKHDKYDLISESDVFTGETLSDITHTFENKFVIEKKSITVEKDWGKYSLEKPTIEIQLYRDGIAYLDPITLVDGELTYTWTDLDKTDATGKEYVYTVDELTIINNFSKKVEGFKITNTYTSPKIDLVSDVDWMGYAGVTPDFEIQLFRNGTPYLDSVIMVYGDNTHTWYNVDQYDEYGIEYVYHVSELTTLENFTTEIDDFDFINRYNSPERDVVVDIDWGLYNQVKPDIEIQLIRNGEYYLNPVILKDGELSYTFSDLDISDEFGVDYSFTVVELSNLDNFLVSISGLTVSLTYIPPKIDITVEKDWGLYTQVKPDIEIQLYRNNQAYLSPITLVDGEVSYTWENLDKTDASGNEYVYTVDELTVLNNFSKKVEDFKITNTYQSETFDLKVNKVWVNYSEDKPTIEVQLYRDGIAYLDPIEIRNGEDSYIFKDLLVNDETGKAYEYTVDEITELTNFEKEVSGFTITNTYVDKGVKNPGSNVDTGIKINELLMLLILIISSLLLIVLRKRATVKY